MAFIPAVATDFPLTEDVADDGPASLNDVEEEESKGSTEVVVGARTAEGTLNPVPFFGRSGTYCLVAMPEFFRTVELEPVSAAAKAPLPEKQLPEKYSEACME